MPNSVQFNGGAPFQHYMSGALLAWVSSTAVAIGLGQFENVTSTALITIRQAIALNLATVGAGGLDTGALAADSWYYVYAIAGDRVGVSGIASLSAAAPALPAGYTTYRRLDSFRTKQGSAAVMPFVKTGSGRDRRTDWQELDAAQVVLAGGTATVATDIACASMLPSTSRRLIGLLTMGQSNALSDGQGNVVQKGRDITNPMIQLALVVAEPDKESLQVLFDTDAAQKLQYKVAGSLTAPSLTLLASGYEETL